MENNKYSRSDSAAFAEVVSREIEGWYSDVCFKDRAIERIVRHREEILALFEKVTKYDVKRLTEYLDETGFFYRPSSRYGHHNYPGGLAEHCLGTFRLVEEWNNMSADERRKLKMYRKLSDKEVLCDIWDSKLCYDDMVVAAIGHDLCKAKHCFFKGRKIVIDMIDDAEAHYHHSSLSVDRLEACGLTKRVCPEVIQAVRLHMGLYSDYPRFRPETIKAGRESVLTVLVWAADKCDASRRRG